MKFKLSYQFFFTQFIIVLMACLMIGLLVSHFLKDYLFDSMVDELTAYGVTISRDLEHSPGDQTSQVLNSYQRILEVKKIHFSILDQNNTVVYPNDDRPLPPDFTISDNDLKQLEKGKVVVNKEDNRFNQVMSVVYVPILNMNQEYIGSIVLNAPISGTEQVVGTINQYMFYTILLSIAMALILSLIFSRIQVNRINKMKKATREVIRGNYDTRLKANQFDEIGELAHDFNQMTETLSESQTEIKRQEKRRRQFIADVSHEMRTPLTTISGLTEGLVNDVIPKSETDRCIALIDTEARRLAKLVNENLDYERIRSNKIQLHKTRFQAKAFLDVIKEQLDYLAEEKGNRIIVTAPDDLEVFADYDRLTQVLINIVKNSIQFTKNGQIEISGKTDYKETILSIKDNGIGMNTIELEQIWDRFYKADMSRTSTAFGESGIGLSIVKQLIEYHAGKIEVESTPEKGTIFTLHLPLFSDNEEEQS